MTPADALPASLLECVAQGADDSPDETRLSLETAAPSAEAGEGDPDAAPYVGQRFPTHDAAYEFYSGFARRCGFSIRRHRTEGKDGVGRGLTRRYFVCHRAGSAPAKPLAGAPRPQRNRSSSRCGCQAYMRIGKGLDAGGPLPQWRVMAFSNHHNHALLGQSKVRLLPAYRFISGADRDRILMFAKSGITVQQMMRIMELEKCIKSGITKDANNHVENIAWTYVDSVQSYELFGDAVVLDTTPRLSSLDMVLGIWVGLNNYGRPFFFACVLPREENQISFAWALHVTVHQGKNSLCHCSLRQHFLLAGVSQLHEQEISSDDSHRSKCVSQGSN